MLALLSTKYSKAQESITPQLSYEYVERLIHIAQAHYPEATIMKYKTALAKTDIYKTNVGWLDALNLSYYYRPVSSVNVTDPNLYNGYQLGLSLNLGTILQKPFVTKEARQQYKIAQLQEQEYSLTIAALVKERYFNYLNQVAQLKLRSKSYTDAEALVKQLRFKFEKGETAFDDYQRALLLSTEQNQYLINAESGMLTAKSSLEELLGQKLETIK